MQILLRLSYQQLQRRSKERCTQWPYQREEGLELPFTIDTYFPLIGCIRNENALMIYSWIYPVQ